MSAITPDAYSAHFNAPLSRFGSVPSEWQRSKSHLRGSSIELLHTTCLPFSSSVTSSGYWEDYESIGASAHEIVQNCHSNGLGKVSRFNRSCVNIHSTWSNAVSPNSNDNHPDADEPWPFNPIESSRKLYYQQTFGSFDVEDEDDRPQSPKSVMLKVPGPTIQMNLSHELLRSRSQSSVDLTHMTTEQPITFKSCSFPANPILPRQQSLPTNCKPLQESCIEPKPQIGRSSDSTERSSRDLGRHFDTSDSDEDDSDAPGERPEPRTLFEAALRRARLADSQREVNLSAGAKSGRVMPDWGSPITRTRRTVATCEPANLAGAKPVPTQPVKERNASPICNESFEPDDSGRISPRSPVDEIQLNRDQSSQTTVTPWSTDWCTGIESWLNSRPRWLYQTRAVENINALQLCYLNDSDDAMGSDGSETNSVMDGLSSPPDSTDGLIMDEEQVEEAITENGSVDEKRSIRGQLFRDVFEFAEVNSRLEKAEQYFDLYFKQRGQDCKSLAAEKKLAELHEKCQKTQNEVHFSLSQASKIARMQLELEKPVWSVVSPKVAVMLKIQVKPRTVLPLSTLNQLTCAQLQLIMNDIHGVICNLNATLMESLMERDELHLEHGAKMTELDDLLAHLKELCIRISIRQYRKELCSTELQPSLPPAALHTTMHESVPSRKSSTIKSVRKRSALSDSHQIWNAQTCSQLTLKQRLISAFSRQKSTKC